MSWVKLNRMHQLSGPQEPNRIGRLLDPFFHMESEKSSGNKTRM